MKVRILTSDSAGHWMSVHKEGCRDVTRNARGDDREYPWIEDHETITSIAHSVCSDFIAEESMTEDESLQHVYFYPCVTLPLT